MYNLVNVLINLCSIAMPGRRETDSEKEAPEGHYTLKIFEANKINEYKYSSISRVQFIER